MSNALKTLARYIDTKVGARLNPLFSSDIQPGTIVDIDNGGCDVNIIENLESFPQFILPTPNPGTATFPEFNIKRSHGISFDAQARLLISEIVPISPHIDYLMNTSQGITMSFGKIETSFIGLYQLEMAINMLDKHVLDNLEAFVWGNEIIYGTYKAESVSISFTASGSGEVVADAGVDLPGELVDIKTAFGTTWKWEGETTLKAENVIIAFETCKWLPISNRIKTTR